MELKPLIGKTLQVLEGRNWGGDGIGVVMGSGEEEVLERVGLLEGRGI